MDNSFVTDSLVLNMFRLFFIDTQVTFQFNLVQLLLIK